MSDMLSEKKIKMPYYIYRMISAVYNNLSKRNMETNTLKCEL